MTPFLCVENALCRIGRNSLLKIDEFALARGEHWCLFGPNGAGKSQLASLLQGRRRESGSYVRYEPGFNPKQQIFLVSFEEQQRLWERDNRLDISEYSPEASDQGTTVSALLHNARGRDDQDESLLQQLLAVLKLEEFSERGIRFLSSGQVRKALLARALYGVKADSGGLLILDDPLESIDRESRQQILGCIEGLLDDHFASLYLSRRVQEIPPFASHMLLMRDLQIVRQGRLDEVLGSTGFRQISKARPCLPEQLPAAHMRDDEPSGQDLIVLEDVTAAWSDTPVLSAINWRMTATDHVLFEGPNGCGKSTLLSLIDGDNHKGYGQNVELFGRRKGSGESVWDVKAHFGIVSNELHNKYVKGWRVLDVVVSGFYDSLGLYDDSGAAQREEAQAWLKALELEALAGTHYQELSFGQQRLVLLARAMVKQPRILVLDEPCVGLDDYHRRFILTLLDRIANQYTTQLIYVSHITGEQPECINRHFRFVPAEGGAYTLKAIES